MRSASRSPDPSRDSSLAGRKQHAPGGYSESAVAKATATATIYGWLASWDTTTVPDGPYTLQSVAYAADGNTGRSSGVAVTVKNTSP